MFKKLARKISIMNKKSYFKKNLNISDQGKSEDPPCELFEFVK